MLTSRPGAYVSRCGDFCAHDDDNITDYFILCACDDIVYVIFNMHHVCGSLNIQYCICAEGFAL